MLRIACTYIRPGKANACSTGRQQRRGAATEIFKPINTRVSCRNGSERITKGLTVYRGEGHDVPGVGGQRQHVQLVVAHEAALAVPQGEHEALVEPSHHIAGALRAEPEQNKIKKNGAYHIRIYCTEEYGVRVVVCREKS